MGSENRATNKWTWRFCTRLLFITRCVGPESAQAISELLDKNLNQFNSSIEKLKSSFTFVTDCAATMPAVFGASVSPNRVPYSERWVGCMPHQLNTVMKHAFEKVTDSAFENDVGHLKKLIRIFKKSGMN